MIAYGSAFEEQESAGLQLLLSTLPFVSAMHSLWKGMQIKNAFHFLQGVKMLIHDFFFFFCLTGPYNATNNYL